MKKMNRILAFALALTLFVTSFAGILPVKVSAEEAITRVYFYNSDNWEKVNAYTFDGADLGGWPGTAATRDGETDWWYVEVPADPAFTIIFNNNAGAQTKDVPVADKESVYVTVASGTPFATKEAAEKSLESVGTKVWFYNSNEWAAVNAYTFGGADLGGWPGVAATRDGETNWWYVEVPANPAFTIIFNNNAGAQTKDVPVADKESVYVTAASGTPFATKEAAEKSLESVGTKVWFYNSNEWAAVNAYTFGGADLGGWPGVAATRDGETNWWYVEVPADPAFKIIFNNNAGSQTGDIPVADKESVYVTVTGGTPFATKEAAEKSLESVGTKVWFYNSNEWAAVNAYTFGGADLGGWPGVAATRDGETNWWYVEVPANPEFTIIFNDGGSNQTANVLIADKDSVYVAVNATVPYATKEAAEKSFEAPEEPNTKVWFYNSDEWAAVNAYVFGASNGESLGGWPGAAATRDGETNWWYVEVPANPEFTIIFNDGGSNQTANVLIADKDSVYVAVNTDIPYATKEAAEKSFEAPEEPNTKVWFYNSDEWAAVNAYVFGASNGESLGGWPGAAATRDGETDWWYVEVPANPEFTIIFNDGGSNQTKNIPIVNKDRVYATVTSDIPFETKEAAEKSLESVGTKVWFYNSDEWAAVNAYTFGGADLGSWPGVAATRDGETNWWYVEVPANPAFTIIFNNNAGSQTKDVPVADKESVYVTVTSGTPFATKEAAEKSLESVGTKVWFYNSNEWAAVNAYTFGGADLGGWPGVAATRDGETNWWYVEVPANPEFTIIFNDGGSNQTANVLIADKDSVYVAVNTDIPYATKEAAEKSFEAPEEPNTKVWFYNSDEWAAVNAYTFGGADLGGWPGVAATRDGETNWWYVEVPANPAFTIIFNNNADSQTKDIPVADKESVYVTVTSGTPFATKEAAEKSLESVGTKVWFYNSNEWAAVNAYAFGGADLGSWPGVAATRDGETNWWYVEVPANPEFKIIFNNGAGSQTGDIPVADKENVYVTVNCIVPYATKEAAEESIANAGSATTTVWFYNSNEWAAVNAYVFGATNGEALGTWPGTAATRDGETDWWYVEVSAAPQFQIIFNNGAGAQTKDIPVVNTDSVYVTINCTEPFATKEAAEDSIANAESATTKIWYYNSENWENVNIYVFGATNGEVLGTWPGTAATRDGETDWWYVEVPAGPEFGIVVNNGAGSQTMDVTIKDAEHVYVTVTGTEPYGDKATAEAAQKAMDEERKGTIRVWFYNSEGWAYVNAYVFGSSKGEALGTWPGTRATRSDDSDRWWYMDLDVDRPFYIIFNNGGSAQTPDTPITDNVNVYVTVNKDGVYSSKEAAEASISYLKPLLKPYTKVWFYNSLGWKNVCAYAWGDGYSDPLGAWPGSQATQYEDTDWWYFTCNFPAPFNIIFNDGVLGGAQTQGVYITDNWNIYTTYQSGKKYSSMEAAEAAVGAKTKVYFYNTNGWSEVYAYTWGGAEGEAFGGWPGTLATRESKDSYWYYVELLSSGSMNIIFSDGVDKKTNDIVIDDPNKIYVTVNSEKFGSKEDAEATIDYVAEILPPRSDEAHTVWYYNSENWNEVYLYVENADGEAFFGKEPGILMYELGTTGWFYMDVATDFDFTVKFSDGADAATRVFTVSDDVNTYFTVDGQYTSKEEAMGLPEETVAPTELPVQEEPVQEGGNGAIGAVVIVILVLAIGAGVLVLVKKRGKKTAV